VGKSSDEPRLTVATGFLLGVIYMFIAPVLGTMFLEWIARVSKMRRRRVRTFVERAVSFVSNHIVLDFVLTIVFSVVGAAYLTLEGRRFTFWYSVTFGVGCAIIGIAATFFLWVRSEGDTE
jgi:hypothetical protein